MGDRSTRSFASQGRDLPGHASSGPLHASTGPPNVLLAEDDESSRRVLAQMLRRLGMVVEELVDGGRLLVRLANDYRPGRTPDDVDLIISDVRMPVCNGLHVLLGIRAAQWSTPILLMTGYPSSEVLEACGKLDAQLLVKPYDLEDFERMAVSLVKLRKPHFQPTMD